jgi:hypothetical protein
MRDTVRPFVELAIGQMGVLVHDRRAVRIALDRILNTETKPD